MTEKEVQAGDTLPVANTFYIQREIEEEVKKALFAGEWCRILDSRQVGKSSLVVRVMGWLRNQGTRVAFVDTSSFGSFNEEQLCFGLMEDLAVAFNLDDPIEFWEQCNKAESYTSRWERFLEEKVLALPGRTVVCLDELERIFTGESFGEFKTSLARMCDYQAQGRDGGWERLTFCLIDTSIPEDFGKGDSIFAKMRNFPLRLEYLTLDEAQAFLPFLKGDEQILEEIMKWTSGHPYMTAKLVNFISEKEAANTKEETARDIIDCAVHEQFLSCHKGFGDRLLLYIKNKLIKRKTYSPGQLNQLSSLYQCLLDGEEILFQESWGHITLVLVGLAVKREGKLLIRNRIIQEYFSHQFVKEMKEAIEGDI